ncbi:LysM peptidoglycan-binding domain-containing protein [Fredinandcohnia sp. QZ13]|uniref:LysM peptidoglycan-binding domain-containing protein n=1 Tax=Fredinandcohnia sp. QZ13 TaxID=3073144 RepID=UPI00285306C7|nr:LysM peptidoglycan-binding domain-containing protein [Fredinandcohnia sp. QZ13]MDR4885972.1 LysM peptidoglycan-binding domain-containing protein [Fredinandcohnia sp. QZ13]
METFTHYKINETEHGIEIVLYMNENTTEFSAELGSISNVQESSLKNEAISFIKRKLPSLKIKTVKVMAGGILFSVLGIGALPADKASAAKKTSTPSHTASLSYTVSAGDTLYSIAQLYGTTVNAIKEANHLTSDLLQVGQTLSIPSGGIPMAIPTHNTYQVVSGDTLYSIAQRHGTSVDTIKKVNQLSTDVLSIGQTLTIPYGNTSSPTQATTTYQVVSGDTLYSIAQRHGTSVDGIKKNNQLTSDILSIGQTLTIPSGVASSPPQASTTTYQVVSGDTLYSIAQRNGTSVDGIKKANQLSSDILSIGQTLTIPSGGTASPAPAAEATYQVAPGDTLYSIANRNGTSVDAIKRANNLSSNLLEVGQELAIPSSSSKAPAKKSIASKQQSAYNQEDVEWLAKMIYSEARGESLQGQIAVGAVIMNRVKSPLFPNTVKDVLFEKSNGYYQFTPAETGVINTATPNAQHIEAAKRAISGEDPTNGALFFYNPDKTSSSYLRSRTVSTTIGNHVFAF